MINTFDSILNFDQYMYIKEGKVQELGDPKEVLAVRDTCLYKEL